MQSYESRQVIPKVCLLPQGYSALTFWTTFLLAVDGRRSLQSESEPKSPWVEWTELDVEFINSWSFWIPSKAFPTGLPCSHPASEFTRVNTAMGKSIHERSHQSLHVKFQQKDTYACFKPNGCPCGIYGTGGRPSEERENTSLGAKSLALHFLWLLPTALPELEQTRFYSHPILRVAWCVEWLVCRDLVWWAEQRYISRDILDEEAEGILIYPSGIEPPQLQKWERLPQHPPGHPHYHQASQIQITAALSSPKSNCVEEPIRTALPSTRSWQQSRNKPLSSLCPLFLVQRIKYLLAR